MPDPVVIRRLGAADIESLRSLNEVFGQAFEDPEAYGGEAPSDDYLGGLLGKAHVVVLVAEAGKDIIGGLVAYELDKFEQQRSEIYIYDLAVLEAYRRRGAATSLIRHLQAIAADRGAWVVYVQADYGDDPAIALYTKLGVREDVMHFDLPVEPSEG
jgi:aminoglycoside 3-N-acetyltransferase I